MTSDLLYKLTFKLHCDTITSCLEKRCETMKKGISIFLTIVYVLMIIGAIECAIFAITYKGDNIKVENASDINLSDIDEYTILYVENLEILERYAFKTVYEYRDSEGTYTDTTYYVYEASHPMDKHKLFAEYYIVKFRDKNNKEYIASLSVAADDDIASSLKNTPLQISACVGASPFSSTTFLNTYDKQLRELRETSLNNYSQQSQIERTHITLGYQAENIEQYNRDTEKDVVEVRVMMAIFSVALLAVAVWLIRVVRKAKIKNA